MGKAWLRFRKLDPFRAEFGTFYYSLDEGHAVDAVFDGGEVEVLGLLLAGDFSFDCAEGFEVDVGKGFEVTFGMTGGDAGEGSDAG